MTEPEVILAIVGVLATAVGFLGWIIQKQFNQNNTTIKESTKANIQNTDAYVKLSQVIEKLQQSICAKDAAEHEFQTKIVKTLDKISTTQDIIMNRQLEYGEDIVCTKEIVVTTIGGKIKGVRNDLDTEQGR
jgi:hypothetical protein